LALLANLGNRFGNTHAEIMRLYRPRTGNQGELTPFKKCLNRWFQGEYRFLV